MGKPIQENNVYVILGVMLLFLLINFNQELGIIFSFMLLVDYIIFTTDSFPSFKTETKGDNRLAAVLYGVLGYGVFILLASVIAGVLNPIATSGNFVNSVLKTLSTSVPLLSDSRSLTIFAWGVLIPILETRFFFGRLMEFLADQSHTVLSRANMFQLRNIAIYSFISGIFTLFHLNAKAAQGQSALIITFVFGIISCLMVVWFGETKQAIGTHITSNTIAVLGRYSII